MAKLSPRYECRLLDSATTVSPFFTMNSNSRQGKHGGLNYGNIKYMNKSLLLYILKRLTSYLALKNDEKQNSYFIKAKVKRLSDSLYLFQPLP